MNEDKITQEMLVDLNTLIQKAISQAKTKLFLDDPALIPLAQAIDNLKSAQRHIASVLVIAFDETGKRITNENQPRPQT